MDAGVSTFRLPGGYFDERGRLHDVVELAPLAGRDEELLASHAGSPAAAVTELLGRTLRRIGDLDAVDEAVARGLLVADRQFLLLKLRELTYGARVSGSCFCDYDDCRRRVGLNFSIGDLPVRLLADKRSIYECRLNGADGGAPRVLGLRLPTGGDQEALGAAVAGGAGGAEALRFLVRRCLVHVGDDDGAGGLDAVADALSPRDLLDVEHFLAATAPAVDLEVRVGCAECQREFAVQLDIQDFFFGELVTSAEQLYKEVHYLAFHYHWSEQEILSLSKSKRQRYIGILADQLEELNAGA